jgi:hypothetical protein
MANVDNIDPFDDMEKRDEIIKKIHAMGFTPQQKKIKLDCDKIVCEVCSRVFTRNHRKRHEASRHHQDKLTTTRYQQPSQLLNLTNPTPQRKLSDLFTHK